MVTFKGEILDCVVTILGKPASLPAGCRAGFNDKQRAPDRCSARCYPESARKISRCVVPV